MDVVKIQKELRAFIKRHNQSFHSMVSRETALLEMGTLIMVSEHYRLAGYSVQIENDKGGLFSVKLSSRGHPYNFSWFTCQRSDVAVEIHSNLAVGGAHKDGAVYVVDVAVVNAKTVPRSKGNKPWVCLDNAQLITFVETKKLVVYPMLLAQFIGIVHEIKPKQLKRATLTANNHDHFYPALVSVGYLQGTSRKILAGFS